MHHPLPRLIILAAFILFLSPVRAAEPSPGPYLATGIKIGEPTAESVIVWVRLTRNPERVPNTVPMPSVTYVNPATSETRNSVTGRQRPDFAPIVRYPDRLTVETIQGAAPGAEGQARLLYRPAGQTEWRETAWLDVDPARDFTRQFTIDGLEAATDYNLRVETRAAAGAPTGTSLDGRFRTAPAPDAAAPVTFTVITGTSYGDRDLPDHGYKIYPEMLKLDPDFFVHTGDILYYDTRAKTPELALWHWQRMYSLPTNIEFHRQVPTYFIKDDHDTWCNDAYPGMPGLFMGTFTFEQGKRFFLDQVPMGEKTWRTVRWGRDLQVWMVEGRDFRSPNPAPDGPDKTIWGAEQTAWVKRTMAESDATFRILISPTPLVGPDRGVGKSDNHANEAFATEGRELREFLAALPNTYVVCGDRHWQYVSVDSETGLREYCSGPGSDAHAAGWNQEDVLPEHRYLNVVGGFLAVRVDRPDGEPTLTLRHHGVDGTVLNEDVLKVR